MRLEYLPVGNYVLAETENPEGYATADPILINIEEKGHLKEIQYFKMGDKPLELEVSKADITGGKEVNGAKLAIYPVDERGNVSEMPLVLHQPQKMDNIRILRRSGFRDWTEGTRRRMSTKAYPARFQPGI